MEGSQTESPCPERTSQSLSGETRDIKKIEIPKAFVSTLVEGSDRLPRHANQDGTIKPGCETSRASRDKTPRTKRMSSTIRRIQDKIRKEQLKDLPGSSAGNELPPPAPQDFHSVTMNAVTAYRNARRQRSKSRTKQGKIKCDHMQRPYRRWLGVSTCVASDARFIVGPQRLAKMDTEAIECRNNNETSDERRTQKSSLADPCLSQDDLGQKEVMESSHTISDYDSSNLGTQSTGVQITSKEGREQHTHKDNVEENPSDESPDTRSKSGRSNHRRKSIRFRDVTPTRGRQQSVLEKGHSLSDSLHNMTIDLKDSSEVQTVLEDPTPVLQPSPDTNADADNGGLKTKHEADNDEGKPLPLGCHDDDVIHLDYSQTDPVTSTGIEHDSDGTVSDLQTTIESRQSAPLQSQLSCDIDDASKPLVYSSNSNKLAVSSAPAEEDPNEYAWVETETSQSEVPYKPDKSKDSTRLTDPTEGFSLSSDEIFTRVSHDDPAEEETKTQSFDCSVATPDEIQNQLKSANLSSQSQPLTTFGDVDPQPFETPTPMGEDEDTTHDAKEEQCSRYSLCESLVSDDSHPLKENETEEDATTLEQQRLQSGENSRLTDGEASGRMNEIELEENGTTEQGTSSNDKQTVDYTTALSIELENEKHAEKLSPHESIPSAALSNPQAEGTETERPKSTSPTSDHEIHFIPPMCSNQPPADEPSGDTSSEVVPPLTKDNESLTQIPFSQRDGKGEGKQGHVAMSMDGKLDPSPTPTDEGDKIVDKIKALQGSKSESFGMTSSGTILANKSSSQIQSTEKNSEDLSAESPQPFPETTSEGLKHAAEVTGDHVVPGPENIVESLEPEEATKKDKACLTSPPLATPSNTLYPSKSIQAPSKNLPNSVAVVANTASDQGGLAGNFVNKAKFEHIPPKPPLPPLTPLPPLPKELQGKQATANKQPVAGASRNNAATRNSLRQEIRTFRDTQLFDNKSVTISKTHRLRKLAKSLRRSHGKQKEYIDVLAIKDCEGSLPGQLSFKKGQTIKQLDTGLRDVDGMFYGYYRVGRLRRKVWGIYPSTHVSLFFDESEDNDNDGGTLEGTAAGGGGGGHVVTD